MTPTIKSVRRVTVGTHRGRRTVVAIGPGDLLSFREHGRRRTFYLTIAAGFDLAIKIHAAHARAEKARLKKLKGKS